MATKNASAEKEEDLDLDAKKPSNKKMLILYVVIGMLLIGMGVMGTMLLMGGKDQKGGSSKGEAVRKEVHYLPLDSFVVNFGAKGPARFLQVDLQVSAGDEDALKMVKENMPAVRNDVLMLLGSQTFAGVSTREGKEKLRRDIVDTINRILADHSERTKGDDGKKAGPMKIDTVYFTSFVMQ